MTDPVTFASATPRHALPLLFAGQAQKELTVNEAHALTDALLHPAIEDEASSPPGNPDEGQCWLVGPAATGAWAGEEGNIAYHVAGNWLFLTPRDGMHVFDRSTRQQLLHFNGWQRASTPAEPANGVTVDAETRQAISDLIEALGVAGILPSA